MNSREALKFFESVICVLIANKSLNIYKSFKHFPFYLLIALLTTLLK
jgi:hypothetical protein